MKRILLILIAVALALTLCACGNGTSTGDTSADALFADSEPTQLPAATESLPDDEPADPGLPNDEPADDEYYQLPSAGTSYTDSMESSDETDDASADEVVSPEDVLTPVDTPAPTLAPSYSLVQLTDCPFGYTMVYPAEWDNLPGKYTLCFRERIADDAEDCPARLSITKKHFAHAPNKDTAMAQFESFAALMVKSYHMTNVERGPVNAEASFMGVKATEIEYLAYIGNVEIKGYSIYAVLDHEMYVLHFYAPLADYASMEGMLRTIRDSVRAFSS